MKIGEFDLTYEQYCAEHGVRSSELKILGQQSPAHLVYAREHPKESTPEQIRGTVFHAALLEPTALEKRCHVRPAKYPGGKNGEESKPWHSGSNWCQAWLKAHSDLPVIPGETFADVLAMVGAVRQHPAAALAIKGKGRFERSLFCEDAETGLQLKCRPDFIVGNAILDPKTCQDASPRGFAKAVANFGYDLQAALYLHVSRVLNLGIEHFILIAVEDEPPYATALYEIDYERDPARPNFPSSMELANRKLRHLLTRYQQCCIEDKWPAYSQNIEFLSLPTWSKREAEAIFEAEGREPRDPALRVV